MFGIQVGVGITVAIRSTAHKNCQLFYTRVDKLLRRENKLAWLKSQRAVGGVDWQKLTPDAKNNWLVSANAEEFRTMLPIARKDLEGGQDNSPLFDMFSVGVKTNRDDVVYDFDQNQLIRRVSAFIEDYNAEVDRYKRTVGANREKAAAFAFDDRVRWSETLKQNLRRGRYAEFSNDAPRIALCRPFTWRTIYYDALLIERRYRFPRLLPDEGAEAENMAIAVTDIGSEKPFMALMTSHLPDIHLVGAGASCQCFAFYIYNEDGTDRRENINDWALRQFQQHYEDKKIDKWAVFHYVYGVLHHPGYREKFADNLKRELPRIPFAPDFWAFAEAGKKLACLHLDYEQLDPWDLKFVETAGMPLSYRVEDKMRLSRDKLSLTVKPSLSLAGIPPAALEYRLGNRSALEWVVDQYQVSTDKRSGITSDPNRDDDPEYIVRLRLFLRRAGSAGQA